MDEDLNDIKTQHKIDLAPKNSRKKKPDKETNMSKEIKEKKGSKVEDAKKNIFGVVRLNETLKRINDEYQKNKKKKAAANKKFIAKKGGKIIDYGKKEPRVKENQMEIDEDKDFLKKKRQAPKDEEIEEEEEINEGLEANMKEDEINYVEDDLKELAFTGDTVKDWKKLIYEAKTLYANMEEESSKPIDAQKASNYINKGTTMANMASSFKSKAYPPDNAERTFNWVIDDLAFFFNSKDEKNADFKVPETQYRVTIIGLMGIVKDLVAQVKQLRKISMKQLIALQKMGANLIQLKVGTEDRLIQIEKPVERWVREEKHEESPEEKEFKEQKRKIKEAAKVVRIEKYQSDGTWIDKEKWDKMSPGMKALHRFVFNDAHQNLTMLQWNSIDRENKNKFIEMKRQFRIKRKKEIEELLGKDKEKGEKAQRQFNFFQFRVIDRGVVYDLRGNPFQKSKYQKRY